MKRQLKKDGKLRSWLLWIAAGFLVMVAAAAFTANETMNVGSSEQQATAAPRAPASKTFGRQCGGVLKNSCPEGEFCVYNEVALPLGMGVCKKQCDEGDFADLQCVGIYSGVLTYYECSGGQWQSKSKQDYPYCAALVENLTG